MLTRRDVSSGSSLSSSTSEYLSVPVVRLPQRRSVGISSFLTAFFATFGYGVFEVMIALSSGRFLRQRATMWGGMRSMAFGRTTAS